MIDTPGTRGGGGVRRGGVLGVRVAVRVKVRVRGRERMGER